MIAIRRTAAVTLASMLIVVSSAVAAAGEWQSFDPGPDAVCADGSAPGFLERPADPAKVVLYFEGGGACFSEATCTFYGPDKTYASASD